jgi:hypothetical protein
MLDPPEDNGKMPRGAHHRPAVGLTGNDHPHGHNAGQRDSQAAHEAVKVCCLEFA